MHGLVRVVNRGCKKVNTVRVHGTCAVLEKDGETPFTYRAGEDGARKRKRGATTKGVASPRNPWTEKAGLENGKKNRDFPSFRARDHSYRISSNLSSSLPGRFFASAKTGIVKACRKKTRS